MLCRVRQKCGVLRNMREDRNGPSYEPPVYVQKVDEPWSMNVHPTLFAAVRNYLYNDCPMLPYFFASQNIPCTDTAASISFQRSNGGKLCPKDDTAINQSQYLGPDWFVCLKTKNCCLKTFVEIRVGEKVC